MLISCIANELGDTDLSYQHARYALGSFKNELKNTHAKAMLARILPEASPAAAEQVTTTDTQKAAESS